MKLEDYEDVMLHEGIIYGVPSLQVGYSDTCSFYMDIIYFMNRTPDSDSPVLSSKTCTVSIKIPESGVLCKNIVYPLDVLVYSYSGLESKSQPVSNSCLVLSPKSDGTLDIIKGTADMTIIVLAQCRRSDNYASKFENAYLPSYVVCAVNPVDEKIALMTDIEYSSKEDYLKDVDLAFGKIRGFLKTGHLVTIYDDFDNEKYQTSTRNNIYGLGCRIISPDVHYITEKELSYGEHVQEGFQLYEVLPLESCYSWSFAGIYLSNLDASIAKLVLPYFISQNVTLRNCTLDTLVLPDAVLRKGITITLINCSIANVLLPGSTANYDLVIEDGFIRNLATSSGVKKPSIFGNSRSVKIIVGSDITGASIFNIGDVDRFIFSQPSYSTIENGYLAIKGHARVLELKNAYFKRHNGCNAWNFSDFSYDSICGDAIIVGDTDCTDLAVLVPGLLPMSPDKTAKLRLAGGFKLDLEYIPFSGWIHDIVVDVNDCSDDLTFGLYKSECLSGQADEEINPVNVLFEQSLDKNPFKTVNLITSECVSVTLLDSLVAGADIDWVLYKNENDARGDEDRRFMPVISRLTKSINRLRLHLTSYLTSKVNLGNISCNNFELVVDAMYGYFNSYVVSDYSCGSELVAPFCKIAKLEIEAALLVGYLDLTRCTYVMVEPSATENKDAMNGSIVQHRLRAILAKTGVLAKMRSELTSFIDNVLITQDLSTFSEISSLAYVNVDYVNPSTFPQDDTFTPWYALLE